MTRLFAACFTFAFTLALPFGCADTRFTDTAATNMPRPEETPKTTTLPHATSLVGQLLLPGDGGRRGVEVHVWSAQPDGEVRKHWVLPDPDGRFSQDVPGVLTRISVSAGAEVHRIDAGDLPRADAGGRVDLGAIDLRDSLGERRVRVRAAAGAPDGVVRVGLWIGPPHTGPRGELPSLGSRQFPPLALGSEVTWLLPPDAVAVHFLVEQPDGPGRGANWRSGKQQVFGPYASSAFPLELVLD